MVALLLENKRVRKVRTPGNTGPGNSRSFFFERNFREKIWKVQQKGYRLVEEIRRGKGEMAG